MTIILPMCPVGINNAYGFTFKGGVYKNSKIKVWEENCLKELLLWRKQINKKNYVDFKLTFYFEKSIKGYNDIDGRLKFVLDMMQKGGFFEDDSFIEHIDLYKKFDKESQRIEIEL